MALLQKIQDEVKIALKGGDAIKVSALRQLVAAIQNEQIAKGKDKELSDTDVEAVLRREAKKRAEAAEIYKNAGRQELADHEEQELTLIKGYLPPELSDGELDTIVKAAVAGAGGDFGKAMGAAMAQIAGRAESGKVAAAVRQALGEE